MNTHFFKRALFAIVLLMSPALVYAQSDPDFSYWQNIVTESGSLLSVLFTVLAAAALLAFFWGLALFVARAGSEDEREKGKNIMLWGVVGLFVIVSIWGIVLILINMFGIDTDTSYGAPGLDTSSSFSGGQNSPGPQVSGGEGSLGIPSGPGLPPAPGNLP